MIWRGSGMGRPEEAERHATGTPGAPICNRHADGTCGELKRVRGERMSRRSLILCYSVIQTALSPTVHFI
jgi:hypothetical protein